MGTGKSLKYTNWKPGQPSGDGDCVEVNFYKPGLWNDKPCHVSRKFMCERGFPEDYKYDEKSRRAFKLHNSKKNWQDAQQTCQMEGGNLVTVDTSEINNILKSEKKRIWIGASDLETEETFLWTNGKPLSYNSWAPGEPNNHGNREDCVEVNFRSPGLWNDAVCGALRPFMCEIDLPTIPTSLVSTKSPKITTASSTVSASSKTRSPTTTTRSSPTTKAPSKTTITTTTTTTKTTIKTKPPPSTTNTTPKKTQTTSKTTTTSTHIQQTTSAVSSSSGGVISLASGGKALASTLWDKSKALRAFQGGQWHSKEGVSPAAPQWIQYEFNQPASVCRITFKPRHDMPISQRDCPTRYEFRGSADGNAFKTLLVVDDQTCQNDVEIHRNIVNCRLFKFYRLVILDVIARGNGNKFAIIKDLKFFGGDQVLSTTVTGHIITSPPSSTTKAPIMTTTTPPPTTTLPPSSTTKVPTKTTTTTSPPSTTTSPPSTTTSPPSLTTKAPTKTTKAPTKTTKAPTKTTTRSPTSSTTKLPTKTTTTTPQSITTTTATSSAATETTTKPTTTTTTTTATTTTLPTQQTSSLVPTTSEGSTAIMLGSNSNLLIKYKASSEWSSNYDAGHAIHVGGGYWCSKKNAGAPLYWWISFVNEPVEIVSITFVERYPAAEVEFFASSTRECAKTGLVLINGTQAEINNKIFANGRSYYCYGLRFTKLGNGNRHGKLASLKKFDFRFKGHIITSPLSSTTKAPTMTTTTPPPSTTTTSPPSSTTKAPTKITTTSPPSTTRSPPSSTTKAPTKTTTKTSPPSTTTTTSPPSLTTKAPTKTTTTSPPLT